MSIIGARSPGNVRIFDVWKRGPTGAPLNIGTVTAADKMTADVKAQRLFDPNCWASERKEEVE